MMEKMEKRDLRKCQGGFTLIEIIAVLVILGILAAVAVPRFLNLQDEAKIKAAEGAIAAGISQIHMIYAQDLLKGTATATSFSNNTDCGEGKKLGDYTMTLVCGCGATGSSVSITDGPNPPGTAWPYPASAKTFQVCESPSS